MTSLARPVSMATVIENLLKRRWSAVILRSIAEGATAVDQIMRAEPDLTILVMNERIRAMVRYQLITRTPRRADNPAVSYRLTPRGRKLLCLLDLIDQLDELELGQALAKPPFALLGSAAAATPGTTPSPADPATLLEDRPERTPAGPARETIASSSRP